MSVQWHPSPFHDTHRLHCAHICHQGCMQKWKGQWQLSCSLITVVVVTFECVIHALHFRARTEFRGQCASNQALHRAPTISIRLSCIHHTVEQTSISKLLQVPHLQGSSSQVSSPRGNLVLSTRYMWHASHSSTSFTVRKNQTLPPPCAGTEDRPACDWWPLLMIKYTWLWPRTPICGQKHYLGTWPLPKSFWNKSRVPEAN